MDRLLGSRHGRKESKHHSSPNPHSTVPQPNQTHSQDVTKILCEAAWDNKYQLIAKLLPGASKEDVNSMSGGKFPLYLAARNKSTEAVLELLNFEGIQVNTQLANGSTPAHAAAWFGHAEILALLLASGASSLIKNNQNLTSRDEAQGECKQVYKIYETLGPQGLKKSYPIIEKLKTIVIKKSVPIRNKKTIVTRQVNFVGILSVVIETTSFLDRCSQLFLSIQVGEKRVNSPAVPYAPTVQWNFKHQFDVNVTSNIPIRFAVNNQDTCESIANLDIPISIVAGEEYQKAMGPTLTKTFTLRTKNQEAAGKKPEMKTILTFTPCSRENLKVTKVFDLLQNYNQSGESAGTPASFMVASGADLDPLSTINPKDRGQQPMQSGTRATPTKPVHEEAPKKFLVSVDTEDEIQNFVTYDPNNPFASGTFGSVFIGTLAKTTITVAIKVISLKTEVDNQKLAKEVYIQFLFDPSLCLNLLPLQMAFQTPNHFTLVMPFCKGGSLQDKLDKYQFIREKSALNYAKQALLGIKYLHSLKVVHRDLKPLNIMFDSNDTLQIIDFGESEFFTGGAVTGEVGTPWYAAPEIFHEPSYTESVDLYALGVTIFELIYGDVPWFWYDKVHDISNPLLNYDAYPDSYRTFPLQNPIDWNNLHPPQVVSAATTTLLKGLICMNPEKRWSAERALAEPILQEIAL